MYSLTHSIVVGGHVEIMSNNIDTWDGVWEIMTKLLTRHLFYLIGPKRKSEFPTSELWLKGALELTENLCTTTGM